MKPMAQDEDMEDVLAAEEDNKLINEECKTCRKKNAPYLYDIVITHTLYWPSLTCQWFQDKESPPNKPYTVHRLLLGMHTSGQAQDYLQFATVQSLSRTLAPTRSCISRGPWSPHVALVFASASSDRCINIWDLALNTAHPEYAHPGKEFKGSLPVCAAIEDAVVVTIEEQKKLGVLDF